MNLQNSEKVGYRIILAQFTKVKKLVAKMTKMMNLGILMKQMLQNKTKLNKVSQQMGIGIFH